MTRSRLKNMEVVEPAKPTTLEDIMQPLPQPAPVTLEGELAIAYQEFREAATNLEGKFKAHQEAEQRYRKALAIFSKLSTGQTLEGPTGQ